VLEILAVFGGWMEGVNPRLREAEEALRRAKELHDNYPGPQADLAIRRAEKELAELEKHEKPQD